MCTQVKVRVLDDYPMGQAERDGNDSTSESCQLINPCGKVPTQVLKGEGASRMWTRSNPTTPICIGCSTVSTWLKNTASRPLSRRTVESEDIEKRIAALLLRPVPIQRLLSAPV